MIVYDEASNVSVEEGTVKVVGPASIDVNLTPDAALEISDRRFGHAMKARGEKILHAKGINGPR